MENSFPFAMAFVFSTLITVNPAYAIKEEARSVQILNAATKPLDWQNAGTDGLRGLWHSDMSETRISSEFALAYVNYLLRVASAEKPYHGGDRLHNLSYENTYSIVKALMKAPPSPERDRAIIIYWAFLATGNINFYINRHEFHGERNAAMERLGLEGKKLNIRALLEANWVYAGFAERHSQRNIFSVAFSEAKQAGLLQDADIRASFERHIERSLDYVASLQQKEKMSYDEASLWHHKQDPKSVPLALAIQSRILLSLGMPQTIGLAAKIKKALQVDLFPADVKNHDEYHSAMIRRAQSAQKVSTLLLEVFEKPGDVQVLKRVYAMDILTFGEFVGGVGKTTGEILFDIEVQKPGTIEALINSRNTEKESREINHRARLYSLPDGNLTPAFLQAFKTVHRLGLVSDALAIDFSMKHDLLNVDRTFALKLFIENKLRDFTTREIIVNRAVLGILRGNLNSTEATYFAPYLADDLVARAVMRLRDSGVSMNLHNPSSDGRDFRSAFENMTIATLFATPKQLDSYQLQPRSIKINSVWDIVSGLYDGALEKGYRYDDAAQATQDRLFLAVVKAIRSGSQDPRRVWEQDVSAVAKNSSKPHLFEYNSSWASQAVDIVLRRLNSNNLAEVVKAFAAKVDAEALKSAGFAPAIPSIKLAGLKSCKSLFPKKSSR